MFELAGRFKDEVCCFPARGQGTDLKSVPEKFNSPHSAPE